MKRNLEDTNTALGSANEPQSTPSISSYSLGTPRSPWQSLEKTYTVQQAAAITGLSEHTLRYYEKIGLVKPVQRQQSSGHRRYNPTDLVKLESIACLRATGMPIEQMRRYFELRAGGGEQANAAELQVLLSAHLQELHRRMTELQTHVDYVQLKIDYWRAVEAHDEQTAASLARQAEALIHTALMSGQSGSDKGDTP